MEHKTVLLQEAVDALGLSSDSVVFDATFGSGGHAKAIATQLGEKGHYIGVDLDATAFTSQKRREVEKCTKAAVHFVNDNFRNISHITRSLQLNTVDAILADFGWRMEQFAEGKRGFSFNVDEPLLMTYGDSDAQSFTAYDIVNDWEEETLANIIFGYGEERFARRIAKRIIDTRNSEPIKTSGQLAELVTQAIPFRFRNKRIHPATKTFQALRIAVNDELGAVEQLIKDGFQVLADQGKMALITFHSIEDRVVKHAFRELATAGEAVLTPKKPIVPSEEERKENPRARSAKLRILTKQRRAYDQTQSRYT